MMTSSVFMDAYSDILRWIRVMAFNSKDADTALSFARVYGDLRWMNHDGFYQDDEIEAVIEQKVLQSNSYFSPGFSGKNAGTVLIASELYSSGGHSAVVMNWMKAFCNDGDHKLLISRSMTEKIEESLIGAGVSYHLCINQGVRLVNEILWHTENAVQIVLHIHPSDIVCAIAGKILMRAGKKIIFYNHADHVFTYGISSANTVCEVSSYGMALNKRTGRFKNSCYLGIPINFRELQKDTPYPYSEGSADATTVLSCGDSNKYAPSNVFFGEFIDCLLLKKPNTTVLLVGPTGEESWWGDHVKRWKDSVQFLGRLDHDKYAAIMNMADVYVDSFPITGGTAFPEALINGKLVVGLQNPIQGYSPADELRVKNVEQLTDRVIKLLARDPECVHQVVMVREKAKSNHSIELFKKRVTRLYINNNDADKINDVFVDTFWIEKHWLNNQEINLPFWSSFYSMSLIYRFEFLLKLIHALKFLKYKSVSKFIVILILNPARWFNR